MVVVDTEEDFDWSAPYSSEATEVHGMERIATLQALFDRYGVRPVYMIDYAIAGQRQAYEPLLDIVTSGRCEIGAHLHPWINPPITEEICTRNSYPFNLPHGLEEEKLRILSRTIEANLGVRPRSYKAGRYGIGAATPGILTDQGFVVDLSVVPTRDYSTDGGPDFRGFAETRPFWFDEGRTLLELPFTTSFIGHLSRHGHRLFRLMDSKTGRLFHLPGIFARLGLINRVHLSPEGVTIREAKALTRHLLANGERAFTIAFHSTSLMPGSTPYVKNEAQLAAFYRWLDEYFAFFAKEVGGTFMTALEFHDAVQAKVGIKQSNAELIPAE
jgi:hypothetical protein